MARLWFALRDRLRLWSGGRLGSKKTSGAEQLHLPDVTLVAVDTVAHELTRLAVEECLRHVDFGDVLVFSDRRIKVSGSRHVACAAASAQEAVVFRWRQVPKYVRTSHYLIVEWDSWIIDPSMWRAAFLEFDYIGAPWSFDDGLNVGNGGFSLRSSRLARFVADQPERYPAISPKTASATWWPDDAMLCRIYRPALEREGFRWADEATASDFAVEHTVMPGHDRHFGFHGMCNWPVVLALPELADRMTYFNEYIMQHPHFRRMLAGLQFRYGAEPAYLPWCVLDRNSELPAAAIKPVRAEPAAGPEAAAFAEGHMVTIFGTLLYIDKATGELRHGAIDGSPANVTLTGDRPSLADSQRACLRCPEDRTGVVVFSTEGSGFTAGANAAAPASAPPPAFELAWREDGSIALQSGGLFLCAEPDGRITHSRSHIGPWETFRIVPHERLAEAELFAGEAIFPGSLCSCRRYHLGCGPILVPGYLNIDEASDVESGRVFENFRGVDGACFINHDLRRGVPGCDNSLDAVYSCHFLEHLTYTDGINLLRQVRLRLKPGGIMRLLVPDLELWIDKYWRDDAAFFADYRRQALGADDRLYRTKGSIFIGMLHNFGHRCGYDFETLALLLREAGFTNIQRTAFRQGRLPDLSLAEPDWPLRELESLCIECEKPPPAMPAPAPTPYLAAPSIDSAHVS
jgi:SAM-dependent methyltransferase